MCKQIDILYPSWNCVVDQCKICEYIVGTNRKEAEIANMVEFIAGSIQMCNLDGDLPTKWAYIGDTLTFYKQFYIAKPSFIPINQN